MKGPTVNVRVYGKGETLTLTRELGMYKDPQVPFCDPWLTTKVSEDP